jgi:restriction system protein
MAYRKNNYGWIESLYGVGILWLIGSSIGDSHYFRYLNRFLFWSGYLLSLALLVGLIVLIAIIFDKIKKAKEKYKINNTYCEHGIKGGRTLELCSLCKEQKEKDRQIYESQRLEQERKKSLKLKATELRNAEIKRFVEASLSNKDFLYKLSPNEFEDVIAQMYRKLGYEATQTPYSNDKGKDIILKKDDRKYLVECKRYNFTNTIGRESLQKFFAAIIEEKAEKGFFVSTSDFKSTAIQYAKDIGKIELINGNQLTSIMREIYPENYNSNLVKIMCEECGDIVEFIFRNGEINKPCKNGHLVLNNIDQEILSPKYLSGEKYCVKCGKPMKLVIWKHKKFWGCSDYPKCKSYQKFFSSN